MSRITRAYKFVRVEEDGRLTTPVLSYQRDNPGEWPETLGKLVEWKPGEWQEIPRGKRTHDTMTSGILHALLNPEEAGYFRETEREGMGGEIRLYEVEIEGPTYPKLHPDPGFQWPRFGGHKMRIIGEPIPLP